MKVKIYHNPRCSKSREALQLLQDNKIEPEIILYLNEVPNKDELKSLLLKLKMKAEDLIRRTEPIFKEEYKGKSLTESQWINAMVKYPKLIERPIIVKGKKAVVGRPPSVVLDLI